MFVTKIKCVLVPVAGLMCGMTSLGIFSGPAVVAQPRATQVEPNKVALASEPATQAATQTGVDEGLRLTITTAKTSFSRGEAICLLVVFTNTQAKPILLFDPHREAQWIVTCRSADGRSYLAVTGTQAGKTPGEIELKPGAATEDIFKKNIGRWEEPFGNQGEVLTALPAGKYTLQATFVPLLPARKGPPAYWSAHVSSGSVKFEINDKAVTTAPNVLPPAQEKAKQIVNPVVQWIGIGEVTGNKWPTSPVITSQDEFEKAWKLFPLKDAPPTINWSSHFAVITQHKGQSRIDSLFLWLEDGKARLDTGSTPADIKGSYGIAVFPKAGIKSCQDRPIIK